MMRILPFLFLCFCVLIQIDLTAQSGHKPNLNPDEFTARSVETGWKEGTVIPNFSVNDINTKKYKLYDLLDKPLVIEIWSLDCEQCLKDHEYLKSFYKRYNINVIGISADQYLNRLRKHTKDNDILWSNIHDDSKQFTGKTFAEAYNLGDARFIVVAPDKTIHKIIYPDKEIGKLGVTLQQYFSKQ